MTISSKVSSKGQITIPAKVRAKLGIDAGDRVEYKMDGEKVELLPIKGTILDAAGSISSPDRSQDLHSIRKIVKKGIARKVVEEL